MTRRWTAADLKTAQGRTAKVAAPTKRAKYGNKKVVVMGVEFDSKHESYRYQELYLLKLGGRIRDLRTQVRFALTVNRMLVCEYVADFVYIDADGKEVVEDAKGVRTKEYIIKRKLMRAVHGIEIREV